MRASHLLQLGAARPPRNLITAPNDFANAYWTKSSAPTLSLDSVGPSGAANTATKLIDNNAGGTGQVSVRTSALTVANSAWHHFAIKAKADQLSWMSLRAFGFTTPADGNSYFNLGAGAIGNVQSGVLARIDPAGNGFLRCAISFLTDPTDTSGFVYVYVADGNADFTVDLDATSSILIAEAQFGLGPLPGPYIPVA